MPSYSGRTQRLLSSGVILTPKWYTDMDIITVHVADDFSFEVLINSFHGENDSLDMSHDGKQIRINCQFRKDSNGGGNKYPMSIASYKGKDICINFWISYLGDDQDMKQTTYSVHMEL